MQKPAIQNSAMQEPAVVQTSASKPCGNNVVRAYGDPLGTGIIRSSIEDFEVTEIYDFEPTGEGEHLLLWIEKRGANTGWVSNQLARYFDVRSFDVSYCGKKDRHAVTRQWFSCWLPKTEAVDLSSCHIEGVNILSHTWHQRKLRRGEHVGNAFKLVVRDLVADHDALDARLNEIRAHGVPNYFGRQRFGHDGQNLDKAIALAEDEQMQSRRKLDRKQKDIYVSALRSWVFNEALSEEVKNEHWRDDSDLWVYGLAPHRDIEIPAVSEEHRQAANFIEALGIKAHARAKRIIPQALTWQYGSSSLTVEFELPVGAYATTVLDELLNIEDAQR